MSQRPRVITRRHAIMLVAGTAGVTLHACAQPADTPAPAQSEAASTAPAEPVKASNGSTLWVGFAPLYVAIEKGFFKAGGLELDYKIFRTTGEGNAAIATGRIESLNNVISEVVAFAAKSRDFRIVQVADSSQGNDGILARNRVKDIADFKNRQIAVEIGSVSHFFLLQVLEEAGLSGSNVKIINATPAAAAAAYSSGRVDIAVTYSPFLQQSNQAQKDGRIIYDSSKMPNAIVNVYMVSAPFVQANPQAVQAFVNGIFKGRQVLETNSDEAYAIAGKMLQLKPEKVAQELKGVGLMSLEDNVKLLADSSSEAYLGKHMESIAQFLKAQGQIPKVLTLEQLSQLVDPTFVKAAQV